MAKKLNYLPSTDFHMAFITLAEEIKGRCSAMTSTTVQMFRKTRTEYQGSRTVDGHETKLISFTVKTIIWMSIRGKDFELNFSTKISTRSFAADQLEYVMQFNVH